MCQIRKNTFKPVKYCYFFFDSQLTELIQNKTKYCNIKAFYKPMVYTHTTSGNIFSANVWISGSEVIFQYKPAAFTANIIVSNKNTSPKTDNIFNNRNKD